MPVSGHFHWSTFVVCNLDVLLARCFGGSTAADDRVPCMLHLDSLGGIQIVTSIIADICRKNILDEWRAVCAPRIHAAPSAEQTAVQRQCDIIAAQLRLPAVCPHVPHQPNFVDCGVYHIAFVEDLKVRNPTVTTADLLSSPPCGRLYSRNVFSHDVCVVCSSVACNNLSFNCHALSFASNRDCAYQ